MCSTHGCTRSWKILPRCCYTHALSPAAERHSYSKTTFVLGWWRCFDNVLRVSLSLEHIGEKAENNNITYRCYVCSGSHKWQACCHCHPLLTAVDALMRADALCAMVLCCICRLCRHLVPFTEAYTHSVHVEYNVLHVQEAAAAFSVLQAALHRQLSNAMPGAEQATAGGLQIASSVTDLLKAAEEERAAFDSMLRDVANLLTPDADTWLEPGAALPAPGAEAVPKADRYPHATLRAPNYVKMLWEIGRLRRSLAVLVMTWAATLHDPVVYARPISHSHSVPNSLRSLQGSEGHARQLSTDSLPDLTRDDAPLQVVNRHAAMEEAELAQQALQADDTQASSVASSENDSVDNRHNSSAEGPQEENADKDEPELESLTVEEQASPTAMSSTPPPALPGGIVAQTILNLERQGQRSTPTRMNAAAAARRFVASALEQRARTLQWLNSSRLSADEV